MGFYEGSEHGNGPVGGAHSTTLAAEAGKGSWEETGWKQNQGGLLLAQPQETG